MSYVVSIPPCTATPGFCLRIAFDGWWAAASDAYREARKQCVEQAREGMST